MDLMVALSTNNDRNANAASVERLANKLSLHTADELREETLSIDKLFKERRSLSVDSQQNITRVLDKLKSLAGVDENQVIDDPIVPKSLAKCASIAVPHEFCCPITLEIMRDPVIVATGQVYFTFIIIIIYTIIFLNFGMLWNCRRTKEKAYRYGWIRIVGRVQKPGKRWNTCV